MSIFWFLVKDINNPGIFYKIQNFLRTSWASIITHKDLLHIIIWMFSNNHDVVTKPMQKTEDENLINKKYNAYKCEKCEHRSATKVSLMKHMNPKHALNSVKEVITEQVVFFQILIDDTVKE